jgi:hypothetical protein
VICPAVRNWNTICKNSGRWPEAGVWARVLEQVQAMAHQGGDVDWPPGARQSAASTLAKPGTRQPPDCRSS